MSSERLSCGKYHEGTFGALKSEDEQVYELIEKEYERLGDCLQLIAAENICSRAVLAALGSVFQNKTAEGFPGARCHGGCEVVDEAERLAVSRAKEAFGAKYANVQPHSGTQANQIVLTALLQRGDKILSMGLDQGGHYSHGAEVSFAGKFFDVESYNVDKTTFLLDYEAIRKQAVKVKPKLIICGASAYSRAIDFEVFRGIAERIGAYLLADISHLSSLVIAGAHQSPIDYAHFTTTSTYKPGGPRGGVILMGRDYDRSIKVKGEDIPLWRHIEATTFPGVQGTPYLNHIAAKAVFFKETLCEEYRARQFKVIENAKRLAEGLVGLGYDVLTGGTDNHMVLINAAKSHEGMTGLVAQNCLEDCGIVTNKNRLPYDEKGATVTSGLRVGTPIVTRFGMGLEEMDRISAMIEAVLKKVEIISDTEYNLDETFKERTRGEVKDLCSRFAMR